MKMIKEYIRVLKIAELVKPKDREIHAVEFWASDDEKLTFRITLDNGYIFLVNIYR